MFSCFCTAKKRRRQPPSECSKDPPMAPPRKDSSKVGYTQNVQHNVPLPANRVVKTPPEPPLLAFARHMLYFPTPPSSPPPRSPTINSNGGSRSTISNSENQLPQPSPGIALGFSMSTFTYEELVVATNGFSDANFLGRGGFGYVHRGILPDGKEVAVKQLKWGSRQGEREFQAEVEIISRVHHKHLVSLVGYCIAEDRRLLIYEFVPNNTLEFHLHGKGRPTMEWSTRLKIAMGAAKGLAYLHEDCKPKIIHRDIKAANILLDFEFEAKVADFGLAKIASDNHTHVSTRVMGTFGYMAPEYASSGKVKDKSDVFSFGVVLLELITGLSPVDSTQPFLDDGLVDWARPLLSRALEDGNFDGLVDPRLQNNYNTNEMAHMVACAVSCVHHSSRHRPPMSQVLRALEGDISFDDLNDGVSPEDSFYYSSLGDSLCGSSKYIEDMKRFEKLAFTSEDNATSEYSGLTSDNCQNPSWSSTDAYTGEMETRSMKKA